MKRNTEKPPAPQAMKWELANSGGGFSYCLVVTAPFDSEDVELFSEMLRLAESQLRRMARAREASAPTPLLAAPPTADGDA
jgi:hypothetical protein